MRETPDLAGQEVGVGTRHRFTLLEACFCCQKSASRQKNEADTRVLHKSIKTLRWSDPILGLERRVRLLLNSLPVNKARAADIAKAEAFSLLQLIKRVCDIVPDPVIVPDHYPAPNCQVHGRPGIRHHAVQCVGTVDKDQRTRSFIW